MLSDIAVEVPPEEHFLVILAPFRTEQGGSPGKQLCFALIFWEKWLCVVFLHVSLLVSCAAGDSHAEQSNSIAI